MTSPSVYDHVRPPDADCPDGRPTDTACRDGVYRVVGAGEGTVTLLRVADADGRRANTGEVVTVGDDDFERFDPAANPDGNRSRLAAIASPPETAYWSVRVFVRQLAAHPLPSAIAGALVLVGYFGERVAQLPEVAFGVLLFAGSLGLAYVGSGRL